MKHRFVWGSKLIAALFLLLLTQVGFTQQATAQNGNAVKGQIDLRSVQFDEEIALPLNGEWEFYWSEFIEPGDFHVLSSLYYEELPSSWNDAEINGDRVGAHGFASYRLNVFFSDTVHSVALKLNVVSTAYRLFINGEELITVGTPGKTKEETQPAYQPSTVFFIPKPNTEILIHVANFDHRLGGMRNTVNIGNPALITQSSTNAILVALFMAGCFFMMGLYHLVLYVINRDYSPLYFSLFCFFLTLRVMITGEIPITSFYTPNWYLLLKMEYLTFNLSGIVFLMFFSSLFQRFRIRIIENTCYAFVGAMSLLVVVAAPVFFTKLLVIMQIAVITLMAYTFYILYKEYRVGNREAIIFFFGYIFFMTTIVNDILFVDEFIETGHLFFFGLFVFLGSQTALLSLRYSMTFKTNIKLLGQLNQSNLELETKVLERTEVLNSQNESLEVNNVKITQQNDELVKLNQELDSFVYSVSHDLKAPIASMIGLLNLSKNEKDMTALKDYLVMMEQSLNKQNAFIGDILDYSRNARLTEMQDQINFELLISKVLEQYEFIDGWDKIKKVIVVNQVDNFISDQQRLTIIFNNLISNALKYSMETSSNPTVEIRVNASLLDAKIEVIDNGSGIATQYQEKVFDMFYRADDQKHGSGLGLYIVKETINKLNGSVTLDSAVGKGTKVTIQIPNLQSKFHE